MNEQKTLLMEGDQGAGKVLPMHLARLSQAPDRKPPTVKLSSNGPLPLDVMLDVPLTLIFEVGRTDISVRQLLEMGPGSFVELRNVMVDAIDIRINDELIAQGEAIALKQRYGVRFGEMVLPAMGQDDAD